VSLFFQLHRPQFPCTSHGVHVYEERCKDYQRLPEMVEAVIYAVMSRIMLRKLATKLPLRVLGPAPSE
jgi:hypothetical protein